MNLPPPLAALFSKNPSSPKVLEIDLARGVLAAPPDSPLAALKMLNAASMHALRDGLREAAHDDRVAGLVVRVSDGSGLGVAHLQELGDMVAAFGRTKPTVAWAETFGELGGALPLYAFATRARQVWLQPSGQVGLVGVSVSITLLRGLLEKGGIEPEFAQRKEYKSAGEQFSAHEISDANREMAQRLADSVLEEAVNTIAAERGLEPARVRELVDQGMLTPDEALAAGLVDRIGYRDEVYSAVLAEWSGSTEGLQFVHRYNAATAPRRTAGRALNRKGPEIGVVSLRGGIVTGRGRPGGGPGGQSVGADVVSEHLRAAAADERIKAVVLRIDSPGGSAVASDTIWRAVQQVRDQGKPVVAQMGAVAASGGYYSAMGADRILALPSTLTGSIGVVAGKFVLEQTYKKLGLAHEGLAAGKHAGMLESDRRLTEEEWQILNTWLDRVYDDFVAKAARGRNMDVADLEPLARGRVWTGRDAHERGLVDEIGGLEQAVEQACTLAGLPRDKVTLKQVPALGLLARFQPANSSESIGGGGGLMLPDSGPEALLQRGLALLGSPLQLPFGALTMPWSFTLR
ncbi:signal peptide peptidase SppA [Propionibacteriaceae bacterium Y1923]|uniref:signal peptide peptidase SppA n=1 Tax=Aestuariimicrobium sp. Y1814 TaxID=3418742 RepID=UPI003C14E934